MVLYSYSSNVDFNVPVGQLIYCLWASEAKDDLIMSFHFFSFIFFTEGTLRRPFSFSMRLIQTHLFKYVGVHKDRHIYKCVQVQHNTGAIQERVHFRKKRKR